MRTRGFFLLAVSMILIAADTWAAPAVESLRATPSFISANQLTPVKVTVRIVDPSVIAGSVSLQRVNVDPNLPGATTLGMMRDDGTLGDDVAGDRVFTLVTNLQARASSSSIRLRVRAVFSPGGTLFSELLLVAVGQQVSAGASAVVFGPGRTSMVVPAATYDVVAAIEPLAPQLLTAPVGALPLAAIVKVLYQPVNPSGSFPPPSAPLRISVPAPAGSVTNYVVGQEVVTDDIRSSTPGLTKQLMLVDSAVRVGSEIVTESTLLPGAFGGGIFAFLANTGSGFVTGTVTGSAGPAAGVVVSSSTNTLVAVTSGTGQYTLYVSGGPFSVTAFDPFRGSGGTVAGTIGVSGSIVAADIALTPLAAPPITRDGIRNSGFEHGDLTSWTTSGAASVLQQFGPTSTGVVILPREGMWMADISTGAGSVGGIGSALTQQFIVPAGARTLRFDFNFISEEFPEFVGSIYNDTFTAVISTPNGETTFAGVSVNSTETFELIGDCFFPGGDNTCGQTGWAEGSVDLSLFSGTNTPITVGLLFSDNDAGDNIYDTHILIDNLRFSTLWIDTKLMIGSSGTLAKVLEHIGEANDILSQAGINIQLSANSAIADPGGLLDLDATPTGFLTTEEAALTAIARSATATDLNIYYVRSLTGFGGVAIALGPDDLGDVNILTNSGIAMTDDAFPETLAHEIGHILISPQNSGDVLEHNVGVATNIMDTPRTVPRNVLSREQSANMNRIGAPILESVTGDDGFSSTQGTRAAP